MKSALYTNTCPFCGSQILEPRKAEQYASLAQVLDKTRLTSREEIDVQIKDKLIEILTRHFEFTKRADVDLEEDVIVVPSDEESEIPVDAPSVPARAAKPRKAKKPLGAAAQMYQQAQDSMYGDEEAVGFTGRIEQTIPEEQLSPEEMSRFFPEAGDDELTSKVEAIKQKYKTRFGEPSAGQGIKRL